MEMVRATLNGHNIATSVIIVSIRAKVVVRILAAESRCSGSLRVECVECRLRAVTSGRDAQWVQVRHLNTSSVPELIDIGQTDSRAAIRQIDSFLKIVYLVLGRELAG